MTRKDGAERFNEGVELFRARNFDGAIKVWEELAAEDYDHPNLELYLGAARRERTRQEQFVDGFSEDLDAALGARDERPHRVDAVPAFDVARVRALFEERDWDEALRLLRQAADGDPANTTVLLLLARVHLARGNMEAALATADRLEALDPRDAQANASLGDVLAELDQRERAERAYRRAVALDEDSVGAWVGLGTLCFEQRRLRLAEDCLGKALRLHPGHINATSLLDELRELSEANARAIDDARKVVAEHPDWPDWQHRLGVALMAFGDHEGAHACFTKALEVNGRLAKTWYQRGILLGLMDRHDEACHDLRRALELADDFDDDLFDEARALEEKGAWEDAASVYGRAMRFDTNYASRHIDLAKRFFEEGLFAEAEREVAKGLSLSAHYPDGYWVLARLQLRAGRTDEAVDSLHRALEINPRYGSAVLALVECLLARGEEEEARTWATRYERELAGDATFLERLAALMRGEGA